MASSTLFRHSAGIPPYSASNNRRDRERIGGFYSAIPPFPIGRRIEWTAYLLTLRGVLFGDFAGPFRRSCDLVAMVAA